MRSHIELDGRPYAIVPEQWRRGLAQQMAAKTSMGDSRYSDASHFDYWVQTDFSGGIGALGDTSNGSWFHVGDARHSGVLTVAPSVIKGVDAQPGFAPDDHLPWTGSMTFGPGGDHEQLGVLLTELGHTVMECVIYFRPLTPVQDVALTFDLIEVDYITGEHIRVIKSYPNVLRSDAPQGYQNHSVRISWREVIPTVSTLNHILAVVTFGTQVELATTNADAGTNIRYHDGSDWVAADTPILGGSTCAYAFDYMAGFWPRYEDSRGYYAQGMLGEGGGIYYDSMDQTYIENPPIPDEVPAGVTERATGAAMGKEFIFVAYGENHNAFQYERNTLTWTDLSAGAYLFEIGGGFLWKSYRTTISYFGGSTVLNPKDITDPDDWEHIDVGEDILDIRFHGDFLYYLTKSGLRYIGYGDLPMPSFYADFNSDARIYFWQNRLYIHNNTDLLEWDQGTARNISPLTADGGLPKYADGTIESVYGTNAYLYCCVRAQKNYGKSGIYCWNGRGWSCVYLFGNHVGFHDMRAYQPPQNNDEIPGVVRLYLITTEGYAQVNIHERAQIPYNEEENISPSSHPFWIETPWLYGGLVDFIKDWESVSVVYDMQANLPDAHWMTSIYYRVSSNDPWVIMGTQEFRGVEGTVEMRWSDLANRPNVDRIKIGIVHQPITTNQEEQQVPRLAALRVKYHAMIDNTWQWNMVIPVEENQQMLDGKRNPYQYWEMNDHLDRILRQEKKPFELRDIDGNTYLVKRLQATTSLPRKIEHIDEGASFPLMWSVTLLQMTPGYEDAGT